MATQREYEAAVKHAAGILYLRHQTSGDPMAASDAQLLRDTRVVVVPDGCIPVDREEYARLRRALWRLMRRSGWPGKLTCGYDKRVALLAGGMIDATGKLGWYWTDAARAFAAEMEGEDDKP